MSGHIPEPDWRQFKRLHQLLLERFCQRTLDEIASVLRSRDGTAHDQYLKVYSLVRDRDKEIARAFNDFRRSTAVLQLVLMRRMGLLADEELNLFSEETQRRVRSLASFGRDQGDPETEGG